MDRRDAQRVVVEFDRDGLVLLRQSCGEAFDDLVGDAQQLVSSDVLDPEDLGQLGAEIVLVDVTEVEQARPDGSAGEQLILKSLIDLSLCQETLGDQMHKVAFFESEADKIGHRAMAAMFDSDLDLSRKNQLRHFILHIDNIADIAEDVADRLSIFALKRAI